MKHELFYSTSEKILFYVAGYTDNSDKVSEIKKTLNAGVKVLVDILKDSGYIELDEKLVNTTFVTHSMRYKYMRVFYVQNVEKKYVSKSAFQIGKDWTMDKWLKN